MLEANLIEIFKDISSVIGGLVSIWGAVVAARAVMLSEEQAIWIGLPRLSKEGREGSLQNPNVQNLLASSKAAKKGLQWVAFGIVLQTIPAFFGLLQKLGVLL